MAAGAGVSRQTLHAWLAKYEAGGLEGLGDGLNRTGFSAVHAASGRASDGLPRFVWTDERPDPASYVRVLLAALSERQRWRVQYQQAVDTVSATGPPDSTR